MAQAGRRADDEAQSRLQKLRESMKILIFAALLLGTVTGAIPQGRNFKLRLLSPDGNVEVTFALDQAGSPTYAVTYRKHTIITPSRLGIVLEQGGSLSQGLALSDLRKRAHDKTYELVVGKTRRADDNYHELLVDMREGAGPRRKLQIIFRAYNDGVAFRYVIPEQDGLREFGIRDERSEFRFPSDETCWALKLRTFHSNYEGEFNKTSLSQLKPGSITGLPLTIQSSAGPTLALAEADLKDYAGMYLQGLDGVANALVSHLSPPSSGDGPSVRARTPLASPWRVVMIGDEPGRLIESTIILNLNKPNAVRDSSWIRPGKAAWDWWSGEMATGVDFKTGMNNATMKHYIDFAHKFGLEYMLVDAGWYTQQAYGDGADTRADITKSIPEIDLPGLVAYARERHVGIIVWIHWMTARDQMDKAFPYYEKIGIKGIKVDFMDHDDQEMVAFYHRILRKAAEHHLLVDLHGAYKPTGLTRTYPNYVTQEGVLGAEYNKWTARITPTHNVTLPFTRMLVGPMDYTPGGFCNVTRDQFKPQEIEPMVMTTRAQQLAMYVVYESPLQMVSDYPEAYRGAEGADFLRVVPTSWDETRVLAGKIGEYIVLTRRRGRRWFIGAMTNESPRTLRLPLNFLGKGTYQLTAYADGAQAAHNPKQILVSTRKVTANSPMTIELASGGGYAGYLQPR
jgi:alpha-glucosidase